MRALTHDYPDTNKTMQGEILASSQSPRDRSGC